ncbi:MAG: ATP-binding cassette domain-containing protein [Bacillota bacterium]
MSYILKVKGINKWIEDKQILRDFNIDISRSTIHALLGPNGAGKTILLKAILGISQPNSGRILFDDKLLMIPYSKIIRKKIGYLPDEPILSRFLTGLENLSYMNYLYDNPKKPDELISILKKNGIKDAKNVLVKNYSKGMKQRLSLAIIDLYNPALLILDEPTLGLDIVGVNHLKNTEGIQVSGLHYTFNNS